MKNETYYCLSTFVMPKQNQFYVSDLFPFGKTQLHDSSGFSPDSILEETSGIDFYVKLDKYTTNKHFNKKSSHFALPPKS